MRKGMRRAPLLLAGFGFLLAGCATSSLDELNNTQPGGSAFNQALFQDYAFLARSFGPAVSDPDDSFLGLDFSDGSSNPSQLLVQAFADKALLAAKDNNVMPEAAPNAEAAGVRARLIEALDATRESFPVHAARAQADYDCWILNASVPAQAAASAACHTSLMGDLARLERDLHPLPVYTPVAAAPIAVPPSDYTILFEFDSWTLTAEDLAVLTQAVNTARAGGQSRITIVGHTDTSGDDGYNQRLSLRRAKVAMEAMIDMGARREAISISGMGKSDLAVQTADGVREAKNRRDVITLLP